MRRRSNFRCAAIESLWYQSRLDVLLCTPMKSCHLMRLVNLVSWRTELGPGVGRFTTFVPAPKERTCDRQRNQAESNTRSTFFDQIYKMWFW